MKLIHLLHTLMIVLLCSTLSMNQSCEQLEHETQFEYIGYGTSFGMCIGYCKHQIILEPCIITFTKSSWRPMPGVPPDVQCTKEIDLELYDTCDSHLRLEGFLDLDTIIGCPDCADGGAEWLELAYDGEVRRVTFEFGNEPSELKDIVALLRSEMETFADCE